ncbi:MAG: hypothetical protein H2069_00275 [Legionella sp.]|nr:hypothetical protein [Legionella sp.]
MAGMIYLIGIGLSRFIVVLLGAIVARQLGHDEYAQFVLFLTASNLLTNLSLMGVVPRILSLPRHDDQALMPLQIGGFLTFMLAFLLATFLAMFGWEGIEKFAGQSPWTIGFAMFMYSGGYFCLSMTAALQNRLGQHAQAGYTWCVFAFLNLVIGSSVVFYQDYLVFLLGLSACSALMGLGLWLKVSISWSVLKKGVNIIDLKERLQRSFSGMLQAIYSGLFGLPFLLVFFLIGQNINLVSASNDKAVFFLGFQLFAITLFMPGVLGNIFVPRLSQAIHAEKRALMRRLSALYLLLGLGWVLAVYLALPFLFEAYAIVSRPDLVAIMMIWQLAGVLAAVGALHNQLLVANREYFTLLVGSLMWASVVFACIRLFSGQLLWGAVVGILAAYTVLQAFYGYKNARYWRRSKENVPSASIHFLANPYSPHVRHWEALLQHSGYPIKVYSAQVGINATPLLVTSPVKTMLPMTARYLPSLFRYGVAGLRLRFSKPAAAFFHAHNTSGYGLMALLSGKPYILTTYGSEIFKAEERGSFYRFLIRRILRKASIITSASASMTACLLEKFQVPAAKIHEFNLGVAEVFCFDVVQREKRRQQLKVRNEPLWIINRRMRPLYRTLEVMEAFTRFRARHNAGHLLLIEGDSIPAYRDCVKKYAQEHAAIHLILGFLNQDDLTGYLSASDFSISVPDSDQLSCSILEGAACGTIPLLAALEAYQPLIPLSLQFPIQNPKDSFEYDRLFDISYQLFQDKAAFQAMRETVLEKIQSFKIQHHLPKIRRLYTQLSCQQPVSASTATQKRKGILKNARPYDTA